MRTAATLLLPLLLTSAGCGSSDSPQPSTNGLAPTASVAGRAVLAGGLSAEGAMVTVEGTARSANVEADGTFEIINVPTGVHSLLFEAGPYRERLPGILVTEAGAFDGSNGLAPMGLVEIPRARRLGPAVPGCVTVPSPDGLRVAHCEHDNGDGTVAIAVSEIASWSTRVVAWTALPDSIRWAQDGMRLFVIDGADSVLRQGTLLSIDPAFGSATALASSVRSFPFMTGDGKLPYAIVAGAGGQDVLCIPSGGSCVVIGSPAEGLLAHFATANRDLIATTSGVAEVTLGVVAVRDVMPAASGLVAGVGETAFLFGLPDPVGGGSTLRRYVADSGAVATVADGLSTESAAPAFSLRIGGELVLRAAGAGARAVRLLDLSTGAAPVLASDALRISRSAAGNRLLILADASGARELRLHALPGGELLSTIATGVRDEQWPEAGGRVLLVRGWDALTGGTLSAAALFDGAIEDLGVVGSTAGGPRLSDSGALALLLDPIDTGGKGTLRLARPSVSPLTDLSADVPAADGTSPEVEIAGDESTLLFRTRVGAADRICRAYVSTAVVSCDVADASGFARAGALKTLFLRWSEVTPGAWDLFQWRFDESVPTFVLGVVERFEPSADGRYVIGLRDVDAVADAAGIAAVIVPPGGTAPGLPVSGVPARLSGRRLFTAAGDAIVYDTAGTPDGIAMIDLGGPGAATIASDVSDWWLENGGSRLLWTSGGDLFTQSPAEAAGSGRRVAADVGSAFNLGSALRVASGRKVALVASVSAGRLLLTFDLFTGGSLAIAGGVEEVHSVSQPPTESLLLVRRIDAPRVNVTTFTYTAQVP